MSSVQLEEELLDLLIKEATEGLSAEESATLRRLSEDVPQVDTFSMEDTIATLTVALLAGSEAPPPDVRERILAAAADLPGIKAPDVAELARARTAPRKRAAVAPARSSTYSNAGWLAAAASLLLALAGWWPRLTSETSGSPIVASQVLPATRQQLLDSGQAVRASWSQPAASGSEPLVGDVVFDPATQRGFLTFRGIPANDPRLAQYQLWIVDAHRKQPEPVDGGVFNVTGTPSAAGTDVVIPFEARLPVGQPAAFVVTLEQPGGVVISKQEKVLALAKVEAT